MSVAADRSGKKRRQFRAADLVALVPLAATVVVGPQLLGGVHPWGMLAHGLSAWLALGAVLLRLAPDRRVLPPAYWGVLGLLAWTWLAALPLPCSVVQWINPEVVAHARQAWGLVETSPLSSCSLSADPGRTREEVIKWTAVLSCYLCGSALARAGYRRWVLALVGVSAGLMTLCALAHLASGVDRVFGLYSPRHVRQHFYAPLLNMNNLGGFLVLGVAVQYGLAQHTGDRRKRYAWYTITGMTAVTAVLTRSRGAIGALSLLAGLLFLQRLGRRRNKGLGPGGLRQWVQHASAPLVLSAAATGIGMYVLREPLSDVLREGGIHKVTLWHLTLSMVNQQPLFGIGRGAFSAVFLGTHGDTSRFAYAENFVIQWAVEWGLPVTIALLGVIAVRLSNRLRAKHGHGLRGATAAGLLAYAFQNLFDLGLEVVACACVSATAFGALSRRARSLSPSQRGFHGAVFLAVGAIPLLWYGPHLSSGSVDAIRAQLERRSASDAAASADALRRGLRLHPQEPVIPYLGAELALSQGDLNTPRLINYALQLAPGWAGPHVLAARWLWAKGRWRQAALEVRMAAARDPKAARSIACAIAQEAPEVAMLTCPTGVERRRFLGMLVHCPSLDTALVKAIDDQLMVGFPEETGPWVRESVRLAKAGHPKAAEVLLRERLRHKPDMSPLWAALCRLHLAEGDPARALAVFQEATGHVAPTEELLLSAARAHALRGEAKAMERTWTRLRITAAGSDRKLARVYAVRGQLELTLGRRARALGAYADAFRIGGEVQAAVQAGKIADVLGDKAQAYMWLRQACSAMPNHPSACEASERLAKRLHTSGQPE